MTIALMSSPLQLNTVTNVCCDDRAALTSEFISWNRILCYRIDRTWKVWLLSSCCCPSNLSLSRNNISFIIDHHRHIWIYQLYSSKRRGSINKSSTIIIIRWRYILTNEDFFHHQRENVFKFHYEKRRKNFVFPHQTGRVKWSWSGEILKTSNSKIRRDEGK
jgi:hypothetical protein